MIDTRLLTFLTLIEEKSYTKTATKLNFTQPAITHHIKSLEKEYNVTLFENIKTFELTKAGKILYEYAKETNLLHDLLINNLKKQEDTSILNIGMTEMVSKSLINSGIINIFDSYLNNYNVYTSNHLSIQNSILSGQLDIGIIDNSFDSSVFESLYLYSAKIILVCKPNGIYQKDRITREMLLSATIVVTDKDSGIYKTVMSTVRNKNLKFKNNIVVESNNVDLLVNMIQSKDAIGFMYEDCAKSYIQSGLLKRIELLNFEPIQNFYILYNRLAYIDDKTTNLLNHLKKYGEKNVENSI
ncbi:MAG: LysR substrate-binding domain-containing protein [Anaeroplasma sp.]